MQHEPMVHIVDDDDAVRDALSLLMQAENIPYQSYASAEEFLDKHKYEHEQLQLGCLLLDIRMPGMNGLELLELLNKQNVTIPVVFITGHGDVSMAVNAMKAGATDFIEKPFDNARLLSLVRNCLVECVDLNNTSQHQHEMETRLARLTKREREVMELLVDGKQNKVIAQELNISPRTVELHRSRVMGKLQAHSLSEIVRIALIVAEKN